MLVEIQDVYDVITEYYHHRTDLQHKALKDALSRVPPAQSVVDEWCYDCKEYDAERHCCPRWNKVIRQTVKDIKAESCWVPCSERLPEEDGSYLVSGKWESGKEFVGDCEFSAEDGYFRTAWNFDVLAWMPFPEPWKGEQNG